MTTLEFVVVLAASPVVVALAYGAWRFSSDDDSGTAETSGPAVNVGHSAILKNGANA